MSGDSFCKDWVKGLKGATDKTFNPHVWGLFLQEKGGIELCGASELSFNPHVWGLFLQVAFAGMFAGYTSIFQSPCLGTLFASRRWLRELVKDYYFQSPCLGTLFARRSKRLILLLRDMTFNPHVWGLFLQALRIPPPQPLTPDFQSPCLGTLFASHEYVVSFPVFAVHDFQSPCLGTLFASITPSTSINSFSTAFNPHVWGLFLQEG